MALECAMSQRSGTQALQLECSACGSRYVKRSVRGPIWVIRASLLDNNNLCRVAGRDTSQYCSCSSQESDQANAEKSQAATRILCHGGSLPPQTPGSTRWLLVAAAGVPSIPAPPPTSRRFRYWIDEPALWMNSAGPGHLLDKALTLLGGRRTGGHEHFTRHAEVDTHGLGHEHMDAWDMLWSSRKVCMLAAAKLQSGQAISNVPGLYMLTLKREIVLTLRAVFGADLGGIMPPTFLVPEEVEAWQTHLSEGGEDVVLPGEEANHLWMLKSLSGLGRGLMLVSSVDGPARVPELNHDNKRPFVVAQKYIGDPLLINNRKFHIRAWMLVTGVNPLRGYLYRKGLLLFSSDGYDKSTTHTHTGAVAASHVTNRHQNANSRVWSLEQFQRHVGPERWKQVWYQLQELSGAALSCGLKPLLKAKRRLQTPHNADFHLLGLDFMLDANYKAWLLEINSNPSLSASHKDPEFQEVLYSTKWGMLLELLHLVLLRFDVNSPPSNEASSTPATQARAQTQHQGLALAHLELQNLSNFVPLMPFFPLPPSVYSYHIPWQPSDATLAEFIQRQYMSRRPA